MHCDWMHIISNLLTQVLSDVGSLAGTRTGGDVAHMAHIGGFVFSMAAVRLFEIRKRRSCLGPAD